MAKPLDPLVENRLQKLAALEAGGGRGYPNDFRPDTSAACVRAECGERSAEELEALGRQVRLAGRMMLLRGMGKATFFHMRDRSGQIQVYVRRDAVGEAAYEAFGALDVGDLVGVAGKVMKTRTGELTVAASEVKLVTKSLRPLPEKYHGLQDIEQRFRQRYVDLIANDDVMKLFLMRAKIVQFIRHFLDARSFLEVETPMMHPLPGGAAARPFVTHHNALDIDLYLRIAPELYLKRLLVGGMERVYEINRNFRNEGLSHKHNPEFTMLEFYQAFATFHDLMDLTEEMLVALFRDVVGKETVELGGKSISLRPPFRRLRLADSLHVVGGLPQDRVFDRAFLADWLTKRQVEVHPSYGVGRLQVEAYDQVVEGAIVDPTFITHHPVETSPLARRNDEDPSVVDRFELIVGGREIANAFSELNDPRDQRARFAEQMKAREAGDEEAHRIDLDYVRALEYGMPPAAGEGIGIDRLVMLAAGVDNIKEVILFPLLRPEAEE